MAKIIKSINLLYSFNIFKALSLNYILVIEETKNFDEERLFWVKKLSPIDSNQIFVTQSPMDEKTDDSMAMQLSIYFFMNVGYQIWRNSTFLILLLCFMWFYQKIFYLCHHSIEMKKYEAY